MAVDRNQLQEDAAIVRFYKIILSWDYLQLFKGARKNNINTDKSSTSGLREVKDTYKNVEDYLATFEPLLFEEVKAQILQGTDEEVTEWKLGLVRECRDADGFHFPTVGYAAEQGELISQNDLLLISKEKFQEGSKLPKTYAFAMVEHRQTDILRLRMFLRGEFKKLDSDSVVSCPRLLNMQSLITEMDRSLWILKICSLSTIAREYVALHSISYLPFKDLILTAGQSSFSSESGAWRLSKALMDSIVNSYNASQMEAINAGLLRKTFVLIQGPPGTGKTQTILGLLSAILHATPSRVHLKSTFIGTKHGRELPLHDKYNHWMKASPWLLGVNNRDVIMPVDGDDGFFPTTGNELKPEVVTSSRKYRMRVLVCAPSNSALDEIVLRILNTGIRDENDHTYNPKIVRIGLKPHHSVQAVSMDYLMEQKFSSLEGSTADKRRNGTATRDRDSVRASILDEAVIVFSTLSFSGSGLFSKLNRGFDVVIIDEAAQAVEPATLVPLANGCKQVFLVGDPVQLPATVISPVADKFGYGVSLFKRFQRAGYPVQMLKTQYRMHPEIRTFPSKEFYAEELEDGPDVLEQTKRDWHGYRCFGPFGFFDIHEGRESQPTGSGSWVNEDEVEFGLLLHRKLISTHPELKSSSQLAIISPYRHQIKLFRDRFRDTYGVEADKMVDVNTVDGFQGREKDVAIFSCVRASESRGIGFVADFRRMNVGITRARSTVLVVGSASTLGQDEHWKNLIDSAEKRNSLFRVSKPYDTFFKEENLKTMKVGETSAAADMDVTYENAEMNVPLAVGDAVEGEQGQLGEDDGADGDGDGDMDDGGGGYDDD